MDKLKRKYVFIGLILLVLIIIFGVTVSYFRSDFTSKNEIIGTGNSVIMSDTFVSPSNWMPGDELNTDFTISNPSNMQVSLRAKVEEKWNNSNLHNKLDNGEDVVLKTIGSNWVEYNGYYYYQNTLANHNSVSTTLFSKLTFNPKVEAGVQCTTVDDVRECSSSGTYTNSKYELKITYEFISSDAAVDNWNYSNTINPNIKAVYTYNEETCQTGNESTCTYSTCLLDNTCVAGTIVDYQVDSDTTNNTNKNDVTSGIMRFHILTNSNNQVTMQSQRNVVKGVAWHAGENDNSHGPDTIVPALENATQSWSNVNTLNTTYPGATSGCPGGIATPTCNEENYSDYSTGKANKARLISLTEATTIGSCQIWLSSEETNKGTCAKWMTNYLYKENSSNNTYYDSTEGNYAYWTSSAVVGNYTKAWGIHNYRNGGTDFVTSTMRGARAVVEINTYKSGYTPNQYLKAAYKYEEGKCEENDSQGSYSDNCDVSACVLDANSSCPKGTIIDYQVDASTTDNTTNYAGSSGILRFHVLYDNGTTLVMQMNKNLQSLNGTAWYSGGNDATKGPATILPALETATNGWINVNNQTYTLSTTEFGTGDFKTAKVGCAYINKGTPNATNCTADTYTAGTIDANLDSLTRTNKKARLITYGRLRPQPNVLIFFQKKIKTLLK